MLVLYYVILLTGILLSLGWIFRDFFNPTNIIVGWWGFWLIISNLSLTGLFVPGLKTQLMTTLMLLFMVLGTLATLMFPIHKNLNITDLNKSFYHFSLGLIKINWIIFIIFSILLLRIASYLVLGNINISDMRSLVFQDESGQNLLFWTTHFRLFISMFIYPFLIMQIIISSVSFVSSKRQLTILIPLLSIIMYSIITFGRLPIYISILIIVISKILQRNQIKRTDHYRNSQKEKKNIIMLVLSLMLLMCFITSLRHGIDVSENSIFKEFIEYHTVGFSLFDQELNKDQSPLHDSITGGRLIFGGIDRLLNIFTRRFTTTHNIPSVELGIYFDQFRIVGYNNDNPLYYNAFSTILYSLYKDGRWAFLIIFPFIYANFLSVLFFKWKYFNDYWSLSYLLLLIYGGLFSIFNVPFHSSSFWVTLLYLFIGKKVSVYLTYVKGHEDFRS